MHTHPSPCAHVCTPLPRGDLPMRDGGPNRTVIDGLNTKLLHMLGITQRHVIEADIRLRADEFASVTLTCAASVDSDDLQISQFMLMELAPKPAPAAPSPNLDLDAMCAAAQERLAKALNHSSAWALGEWRIESDAIHLRMNKALRQHQSATSQTLSRLEHEQKLREMVRSITESMLGLGASSLFASGAIGGLSSALTDIDSKGFGDGMPTWWRA